ncbi:peptidase S41 family protein [Seiridium cupressi]
MHPRALTSALLLSSTAAARAMGQYSNSTYSNSTTITACSTGAIPTSTPSGPCAAVSSVSESYLSAYPAATAAVIPAGLAAGCLNSVPIDPQVDVALIDYIIPFAYLQSTVGFLAKPPEEYLLPGVDVVGGLQEIRANLFDGHYENQFQFVSDVQKVYWRTFDGHFGFIPELLGIFTFTPGASFVSVSVDGLQLPSIYLVKDLNQALAQNYTPSAVATIDGKDAETWLEVVSQNLRSQDPDSLYNGLFYTVAGAASQSGNAFVAGYPFLSLPDFFTLGFANGSTLEIVNTATVNVDFQGITSGELLHQVYELPKTSTTTTTQATTASETASPSIPVSASVTSTPASAPTTAPGYPYPVPDAKHADNYISGYFLNDSLYSDTAVLSVYAFQAEGQEVNNTFDFFEFRRVANTFFEACRAENKTRLVIDLSGNGGGSVMAGYELYKQLFPSSEIRDATRLRASDVLDFIGNVTFGGPQYPFLGALDETEKAYETWQDLFGPDFIYDDRFTNIIRNNFSQPGVFGAATENTTVTGYGDVPAPVQPFEAENIVLVTDGICASTCTIFAGLMTRQEGVRTIAMGGRPINQPMQAIGGVKGAQVLEYTNIVQTVSAAVGVNSGQIPYGLPVPTTLTSPLLYRSGRLNWLNAYSMNDTDTPLQFVYEAANCKRFYRVQNLVDIRTIWMDAADVAWGGAQCVDGSTVNEDGTISGEALEYSDNVRPTAPFAAVPGSPGSEASKLGTGSNCTTPYGAAERRSLRVIPRSFKPVDTDLEPVWINVPKERFGTS